MITPISNHLELMIDRLVTQFRSQPNFLGILESLSLNIQELEDVFFDVKDSRSIYSATGAQLDAWGTLLDKAREGLDDELYRIVLLAKIAQNVSKGTGEDVITIYQLLMRADYVHLVEWYPAKFSLTAINANQIGDIEDVKAAVKGAKAGGVEINLFQTTAGNPFSFDEDPDPNGRGFGDLNNASVGGYLSSIV